MESLVKFIEEHRADWEVPGCAVAVVKGDEVVLNQGFGLRDTKENLPVTNRTLFSIGSTTKAFTAAAVGAMVDDGLVDWRTPVRDYIPGFRLHDPVATERITVLDLLSHRSGLPRHEFTWMGNPEKTRAELVGLLQYLPLSRDIREVFQYCNLGYLTAGYLVEVVSGMTWEDYVSTRLLKALGMDETNFKVSDMKRSSDFSKAHERRDGKVVEIPYRIMHQMGPAGSINSSTTEMLAWIQVNLAGGRYEGSEVISPATVALMQSPQMVLGGGDGQFPEVSSIAYGLGWMVGGYRGHRVVQHGGGIDGFLTELMLLPDDGIGLVVLTNSTSSSLGPVISYRVLDELLGLEPLPWQERNKTQRDAALAGAQKARAATVRKEAPLRRPLEEYAGDYDHPGYGRFSIKVSGDKLVPEFGVLKIDLEHRHFDVFDLLWHELTDQGINFALIFQTSAEGDVVSLTVPFEATVDPIRFERQPDARGRDPQVLRGLTGTYVMGPIEVVVDLKGESVLTVAAAGQPGADLLPGRGLKFIPKGSQGQSCEFVLAEDGSVKELVIQPMGVFTPKAEG